MTVLLSSLHWIFRSLWRLPERRRRRHYCRLLEWATQLAGLEHEESAVYNERLAIGRIADQKMKYAKEQPYFSEAPKELISASDLIRQQQEILARNGENQRKRENLHILEQRMQQINEQMETLLQQQAEAQKDLQIARTDAVDLHDESTAELEQNISDIEEINRKVRANLDKDKAEDDAESIRKQYETLTNKLEEIRKSKMDLTEQRRSSAGRFICIRRRTYLQWPEMGLSVQF